MIRLTSRARADLEEIRTYTEERWGTAQWLRYYGGLVSAFEAIEARPDMGRDRALFVPGMRSVSAGRHVIFFKCLEAAEGRPVVLRVLHERRNLGALRYYEGL